MLVVTFIIRRAEDCSTWKKAVHNASNLRSEDGIRQDNQFANYLDIFYT